MRLALKLTAALCGLALLVLGSVLPPVYRAVRKAKTELLESAIRAGMSRPAGLCALAAEEEPARRRCREGLEWLSAVLYPSASLGAVAVDENLTVLAATESFAGRPLRPGMRLGEGWLPSPTTGASPGLAEGDVDGRYIRVFSVPLPGGNRRAGFLLAAFDADALDAAVLAGGWRAYGPALLRGASLGLLGAVALTLYFLGALKPLAEAMRRLEAGDLRCRVPEDRSDELGEVAAQFNRMARKLAEVDELKDRLVAKLIHDLKGPVSGIVGHADLLASGMLGPLAQRQEQSVQALLQQSRQLAGTVENLLDLRRAQEGRLRLEPAPLEVEAEVAAALEEAREQAEAFSVSLASHVLPGLDAVHADRTALGRVLGNLLSNAVKFTPAGGSVTVSAFRGKPGEVVFTVSDTGIGIPEGRLSGLFEPFAQVPETRNKVRPSVGAGLGLALCKRLVDAMGGNLRIKSRLLKGTEVTVTLPTLPGLGVRR